MYMADCFSVTGGRFPVLASWDWDPARLDYPHSGARNVLFVDGHVSPVTVNEWPSDPPANRGVINYNADDESLEFYLGL
jgi:prepilin-type processing-associated H-X9-DG protein